jgi:hypothetical protein
MTNIQSLFIKAAGLFNETPETREKATIFIEKLRENPFEIVENLTWDDNDEGARLIVLAYAALTNFNEIIEEPNLTVELAKIMPPHGPKFRYTGPQNAVFYAQKFILNALLVKQWM